MLFQRRRLRGKSEVLKWVLILFDLNGLVVVLFCWTLGEVANTYCN